MLTASSSHSRVCTFGCTPWIVISLFCIPKWFRFWKGFSTLPSTHCKSICPFYELLDGWGGTLYPCRARWQRCWGTSWLSWKAGWILSPGGSSSWYETLLTLRTTWKGPLYPLTSPLWTFHKILNCWGRSLTMTWSPSLYSMRRLLESAHFFILHVALSRYAHVMFASSCHLWLEIPWWSQKDSSP